MHSVKIVVFCSTCVLHGFNCMSHQRCSVTMLATMELYDLCSFISFSALFFIFFTKVIISSDCSLSCFITDFCLILFVANIIFLFINILWFVLYSVDIIFKMYVKFSMKLLLKLLITVLNYKNHYDIWNYLKSKLSIGRKNKLYIPLQMISHVFLSN